MDEETGQTKEETPLGDEEWEQLWRVMARLSTESPEERRRVLSDTLSPKEWRRFIAADNAPQQQPQPQQPQQLQQGEETGEGGAVGHWYDRVVGFLLWWITWNEMKHHFADAIKAVFPNPLKSIFHLETPTGYISKLTRVRLISFPVRHSIWYCVWAALGAFIALLIIGIFNRYVLPSTNPAFYPSLAAAAALIFAMPVSPAAQPRSMVMGHVWSSLIAVSVVKIFGGDTDTVWLQGALAVAISIFVMCITATMNPPGAALALAYVVNQDFHSLGYRYIPTSLFGVGWLMLFGVLFNNAIRSIRYPTDSWM